MGDNFGLNENLLYRELVFDSYDTQQGESSVFPSTDWPNFQIGRPLQDIAALKIIEVQIPFTWYVVNQYNNKLTFNDGTGTTTVTIPVGNYNSSQMTAELSSLFTAASVVAGGSHTYTATYNSQLQKFTLTSNQTLNQFTITAGTSTTESNFDPSAILGLDLTNTSIGSPAVLQFPHVEQLTGPNYLYISSVKMGQLTNMYLPQNSENHFNSEGLGPQMAKVPVNVNPGGVIYWQDPDPQKWFSVDRQNNLSQIDFYLTLGNTNWGFPASTVPLALNGANFSLKLGVLLHQMEHTEPLVGGINGGVTSMSLPRGTQRKRRRE